MIKVFIDNQEATPIENSIKLPLYRASSLRDIEGWREGRVAEFEVEASAPITQLLGHCEEAYPTAVFNDSYHTARIEADGVTIIEGVATLIGTKRRDTQTTYHIRVRVGGAEWADSAAMTRLNATAIEVTRQMLTDDIIASWSDNSAVRMLPINRDRYAEVAETGIYTAQCSLLPQDYHPFISVVAIVESIAKESGYTIQSNFLNTPLKDLNLKEGLLVAAIARDGKTIIPDGNTSIHAGDRVVIMAKSLFIQDLDDILR